MARAIAEAENRGITFKVFNPRRAADCDIRLVADREEIVPVMWIGNEEIELNAISGIYARSVDALTLPEVRRAQARHDHELQGRIEKTCLMFDQALDCAATLVANRPSSMGSNFSKPRQLQAIAGHNLLVPPTLVTNDPDAVREFHALHQRIIYKSISAVRSIVKEWTEADGPELDKLRSLPVQFQAFIPGEDIRVHVVCEQAFAVLIRSDATDYRYDHETRMEALELPWAIEAACIGLAASLDLPFAGIDLRRTADDRFYCFEVNPSPAYSYFEELSGQPIAAALVELLRGGAQ